MFLASNKRQTQLQPACEYSSEDQDCNCSPVTLLSWLVVQVSVVLTLFLLPPSGQNDY